MMAHHQVIYDSPRFAPVPSGPSQLSSLSVVVRHQYGDAGFGDQPGALCSRTDWPEPGQSVVPIKRVH